MSLKRLENSGRILEVAQQLGIKTEGDLYADIGYGKLQSSKVVAKLLPEGVSVEPTTDAESTPLERIFQRAAKASRSKIGIRVERFDDILVRFARCCEPLPGDRIIGFITRGRGVTVHNAECPQVMTSDPQRQVEVSWDGELQAPRRVKLTVHSQDHIGLLANVTAAITSNGANINSAQIRTTDRGKAVNTFEITVGDSSQFDRIRRSIEKVPGVIRVERIRGVLGADEEG
jgi:GTP pyrophosphokinase